MNRYIYPIFNRPAQAYAQPGQIYCSGDKYPVEILHWATREISGNIVSGWDVKVEGVKAIGFLTEEQLRRGYRLHE